MSRAINHKQELKHQKYCVSLLFRTLMITSHILWAHTIVNFLVVTWSFAPVESIYSIAHKLPLCHRNSETLNSKISTFHPAIYSAFLPHVYIHPYYLIRLEVYQRLFRDVELELSVHATLTRGWVRIVDNLNLLLYERVPVLKLLILVYIDLHLLVWDNPPRFYIVSQALCTLELLIEFNCLF